MTNRAGSDNAPSFRERVYAVVARIEPGETMSYTEVARRAGNPKAARAVGRILNANTDPAIPCHRVVRNDGSIGGYNQGRTEKRRKLTEEGAV